MMLIDTSGLMCLFDVRDIRHPHAVNFFDKAPKLISHNYVLAEFVALAIARRAPISQALRFIETVEASNEGEVVWIDRALHDEAMRLLKERPDKAWSLCDAVSFLIMSEVGLLEALTTDQNFEQAGFVRLLDR